MRQFDVVITRRGAERVEDGHLWIYRSDVLEASEAKGGGVVSVGDERGHFIGQAFFSSRSEITLRLLTRNAQEKIDREWWRERLRAAFARRAGIAKQADAYRLVYSEGDLMPSLIVDKYKDLLVIQTLSQGTENLKLTLIELLLEELKPRAIIERNDVRVRSFEGLALHAGVLYGDAPDEINITQYGVHFCVSPLGGQKTGAFLDQRENHLAARRYAKGHALDCFTFNGAFAVNIAPQCESVIGIDVSEEAIAAAERNAELNNARNIEFHAANVFDVLREFDDANERFDTIILDPPAFAKNRASLEAAIRGYKEINLRALKMLDKGGTLITSTCSYHMNEPLFYSLLADAAADARRRVQIIEKRIQSSDHPVLVGVSETLYLKCAILRVIN